MDEQYLVGLADKVHCGQAGRALKGLQPGGKCYGYSNVPIEDLTRHGKYGRPAVSGVELAIREEQATVLVRIFTMFASGMGLARIAKKLNAEGVEAPQPPRTRTMRAWCPSSIREMLATNGTGEFLFGTGPKSAAILKRAVRRVGRGRNRIGGESKSHAGGSYPRNFGMKSGNGS